MYELKNVSFSYQVNQNKGTLKNINLTVQDGQVLLICGESGCGKSTLLRLFNGLIPNFFEGDLSGEVLVDGENLLEQDMRQLTEKAGMVFQNPKTQFFTLNSTSELAFGCENLGIPPEETIQRIQKVVQEFKMESLVDCSLFALSGGEKQKIACACVSAMMPDVLLLDEPSSNLDSASIRELGGIIERWKQAGKTIIIVEHRLCYVLPFTDRVLCMKNGEIHCDLNIQDFMKLSETQRQELGLRMIREPKFSQTERMHQENGKKIELKDFSFSYRKKDGKNQEEDFLIPQASFPENEIIALVGNNGAGKSTFGQCLCGLMKKAKGTCCYHGTTYKPKQLKDISYLVLQDVNHQLFGETVYKELQLGKKKQELNKEQGRIEEILRKMNLWEKRNRHPMSLSGGEKQRVAIAAAMVQNREIFIFDEPTSGLDYKNMLRVAEVIKDLKEQGKSIFMITHDPELVYRCCSYVVFFNHKTIEWQSELNNHCMQRLREFFICRKENG